MKCLTVFTRGVVILWHGEWCEIKNQAHREVDKLLRLKVSGCIRGNTRVFVESYLFRPRQNFRSRSALPAQVLVREYAS